jgi:radical SAM superfamily enzyme YgiQ (UPF0313 family)
MKIAFINPTFTLINNNDSLREFIEQSPFMYFYSQFWSGFSNGLLTLAALTPGDIEAVYIDESHENIPFDEKFDIVAITATTQQAMRAYAIADRFKNGNESPYIVIGGSHASFLPEEAAKHVDTVFIGEAENSWPQFLDDFQEGTYKDRYNSTDFPVVDMTKVPVPRYELLDPNHFNMIWIQSSRGCPIDCEFCSATKFFGHKYRAKTEGQVLEEIKAARKHMKMKQILFSDDNMFCKKDRNNALLEGLKDAGISFVAQADVTIGKDPEFLKQLKNSGCSILFIGFESLDPRNLGLMNNTNWKHKKLNQYGEYIRNITEAGIGVYGAFIVGYDYDTKETFVELGKFVTDNYLSGAQITVLTPLPGTDLRERLRKNKRVLKTGWENYTFFDVNVDHPTMSREEIEEGLLETYKTIYNQEYLDKKNQYYRQVFLRNLKET